MIAASLIQRLLPATQPSHQVSLLFPSCWLAPRNPFAPQVQSEAEAWFQSLGVIHDATTAARFRGMAVGEYGGLPFPLADRAGLTAATRFLSLWLFHDDLLEGLHDGRDEAILAALRGEPDEAPEGPPCLRGWWELGRTLQARMSPRWLDRLTERFAAWLLTLEAERRLAARSQQGRPPSAAEYLEVRLLNIGVFPTLLFVELTTGTPVPEAVAAHPAFQTIELLAAGLITIANDLYAFTKDREQGWPNLVASLAADQELPLSAAFDRAAALHRSWLTQLVCAEQQLLLAADDTLGMKRWLRGVHHVIGGLTRWHECASRYRPVQDLPDGSRVELVIGASARLGPLEGRSEVLC